MVVKDGLMFLFQLEMRLPVDKLSVSFDKSKAEHLASISGNGGAAGTSTGDSL